MALLDLVPIKDSVVRIPTQEDYDTLMQIYEFGEWNQGSWGVRNSTHTPTDINACENMKKEHLEKMCIQIKDNFLITNLIWANEENKKIISLKELCNYQKITEKYSKDVKKFFERYKPYRKSKGLQIKIQK